MNNNTYLEVSRALSRGYKKHEQNDRKNARTQANLGKYTITPWVIDNTNREARYG